MLRNNNDAVTDPNPSCQSADNNSDVAKSTSGVSFFAEHDKELDRLAFELNQRLSEVQSFIVAYKPYTSQAGLDVFLSRDIKNADKIVTRFMQKYDVNASNNLGMTLLHNLLWLERTDLAKMVIENAKFYKINYKFCIPFDMAVMYASAFDLALSNWMSQSNGFDLKFIGLLLKHGANPPVPGKKFLHTEMLPVFYPSIIMQDSETRSHAELIEMFCLLHRYGYSIDAMQEDFENRLFDKEEWINGRAEEFDNKFKVSIDKQKELLASFMTALKTAALNDTKPAEYVVEKDARRLENGENTLQLPFDPHNRPCVVM